MSQALEQIRLEPHINHRVITRVVKRLLEDPVVGLSELIANSWDAGATEVIVTWPQPSEGLFYISDNGHGMTADEFKKRWLEIGYNRLQDQGSEVEVSNEGGCIKRLAFGRNGIGKFASFCFADSFYLTTSKNGTSLKYLICKNYGDSFFSAKLIESGPSDWQGTRIHAITPKNIRYPESEIISQIAQRFTYDPLFKVILNNHKISFSSIPDNVLEKKTIHVDNENFIELYIISREESDKTTRYSGIAWHVNGRLVGQYSWSSLADQRVLDGRKAEAKRHTIIIKANCLQEAVLQDWSGFDVDYPLYKTILQLVEHEINNFLENLALDTRKEIYQHACEQNKQIIKQLSYRSRHKWDEFIKTTLVRCPSINPVEITKLGEILATLETTRSKYAIIQKLSEFNHDQWEKLNTILSEWSIDMAKDVLDEIQDRLRLIEDLRKSIQNSDTLEVQELQPIMANALWIFGPEFESIHFTSNQSMATAFLKFKGVKIKGLSKNRPDFVILEDGVASFHSTYGFDENHHEDRISHLVILELKAPGVSIGRDEKGQPIKYVDEFRSRGLIDTKTKVSAFVLGSRTDKSLSTEPTIEGNTTTKIMLFNALLHRAESRLFFLRERVQEAPFMKEANQVLSCPTE